ncbi:MAG: AAA family ATPase [Deltaproteobacteria bacterium]|nr:AAA family ATPase [Deltaproteobacteria bacterium]
MVKPLAPEQLRKRVDPGEFPFETTAELPPRRRPLGQDRAVRALEFGLEVESPGYNIFVLGPPGAGKKTTALALVEEVARSRPAPGDWVYVYNFADEERPRAIELPAGMGEAFRADMERLVQTLRTEIPKALAGEGYEREKSAILKRAQDRKAQAFRELESLANERGFLVQRSAEGLALVYTHEGSPVSQEDFENLPEDEKQAVREARGVLQAKLRETIERVKAIDREAKAEVEALEKRVALAAVGHEIEALVQKYQSHPGVVEHLKAVEADVVENLDEFRSGAPEPQGLPFPFRMPGVEARVRRYQVNVLVNNRDLEHAPVVYESNPTYHNLVGRIEHYVQLGAFVTDFTLIKPGAFHRANGGYLVLDVRDVLLNPFAYDALKRVLKDQRIRMEEIGEQFRLISTTTLKPEPIPARLKVVLLGTPWLYYLLQRYDEDFLKLFKVKGEFSEDMELNEDNRMSYAFLVASHAAEEGLLPFHRDAVARVVEHGLRLAEHQSRMATHYLEITDLVREANHWARKDGADTVRATHVDRAIQEKVYRSNYLEEWIGRLIAEGTLIVETEGTAVGQVNGLSVYDLGDYSFGKPSRVTAKIFLGKEGLVNIERESELGGRIHNKGVLILQGFFGSRYARRFPISFAASLCFEQSYGGIEGDSASSAELFALISALAEIPLRQDLAVTGSVSQQGQIQAVGGINEKIEGFYRTCKVKGLTGTQGVIIPRANVPHLMLDPEVVEAVDAGRFHIYPIENVDQGMELLTGLPAGELTAYGTYPEGTVNGKVMRKLERLAALWRRIHNGEET